MMGKKLPETCWADPWRSINLLLLHLVGLLDYFETVKLWIYILPLIQHSTASDSDRILEVCEYCHDNLDNIKFLTCVLLSDNVNI